MLSMNFEEGYSLGGINRNWKEVFESFRASERYSSWKSYRLEGPNYMSSFRIRRDSFSITKMVSIAPG